MMERLPVVIVGAGVIGLSTALALDAVGIPTVIINPTDYDGETIEQWGNRVSAVARTHLKWLSELGLQQHVLEAWMCSFHEMHVWHDHSSGWIDFKSEYDELGAIIDNRALLLALVALCKLKSIRWLVAEVDSISVQHASTHVHLSTGEMMDAQLVVGADGIDSSVRRLAGIQRRWADTGQSAIVANFTCAKNHGYIARQVFLQSGSLAFLPITSCSGEPNHVSIVWSVDRKDLPDLMALSDKAFSCRVGAYVQEQLGTLTHTCARKCIPLYQSHAKHYVVPGVVLVGDAAHQIHPMAGQGANLGFSDVRCLCETLSRAKERSIALNHFAYLKRYEGERRPINGLALTLMASLQALYSRKHPIIHSAVSVGMNSFNRLLLLKRGAIRFAGS